MKISIPLRIPSNKEMDMFRMSKSVLARDILRIAYNLFETEKRIKDGEKIAELDLKLSLVTYCTLIETNIEKDFEKIFRDILGKHIKVNIYASSNLKYKKLRKIIYNKKYENVCLFSGGVDSFIGLLESKEKYSDLVGVFVAHSDQAGVINIVNNLIDETVSYFNIPVKKVYAPAIRPKKNKQGYSQLRGLLYILCCGAFMSLSQSKNLIVTECGATMYQPKFGALDSTTHTTHPIILKTADKLLKLLLGDDFILTIPFEDMTKAEIIAFSKYNEYLPKTHSCISARFRNNCGTCYGCVIRRLGSILVGIKDSEYSKDILADEKIDDDNLIALLRFSYYFIREKERLKHYNLERISDYGKEDLFTRQSLDILSAFYLLNKSKYPLTGRLKKAYEVYVSGFSEDILIKRIKEVRTKKKKPSFNKIVS